MQIAAIIGITDETKPLYQIYKAGILFGTVNAVNSDEAKKICAGKYQSPMDWRELKAIEVMRS